ncbi:hypothetical protein FSP39_001665 [Pinctada imbricata]|uniref:Uncharacterized protein n=2 Tax=Pinctada imbricata TaxID=66713 RepID=A0AA88YNT4_PINIB|nr:hypothetical protein FSP39_001665 [Pinctada imbricata]
MVTGAEFCDFVVYLKNIPIFIQRIFPDKECIDMMMCKLSKFYFEHIKPKLTT